MLSSSTRLAPVPGRTPTAVSASAHVHRSKGLFTDATTLSHTPDALMAGWRVWLPGKCRGGETRDAGTI